MREIKFRIWNTLEGKWHGTHYKEPKMIGELICKQGVYLVPESVSRNLIVQQYTGLKDKNGKEIYEGDIIKLFNGDLHKVEFIEESNEAEMSGYFFSSFGCEVIGNIFENPNLVDQ